MKPHTCFETMERIAGTHRSLCTECGALFVAYDNWVVANMKEHKKNNPNCPDCVVNV